MSENPTGSIEGIITLEGMDKPISGVQVTIHRGGSTFNTSASTDESGRFFIENLEPGNYIIHAGRDGNLGMRTAHTKVSPGQNVKVPNLNMALGATIRGRILHNNGRPVVGRFVEFLWPGTVDGNKAWHTRHISPTDRQGDYKNSRLAPGEYYIRLSAMPSEELPNQSEDVSIAYFPGTTDPVAALPVTVAASEEATANFTGPRRRDLQGFREGHKLDSRYRFVAAVEPGPGPQRLGWSTWT
jgi:hypothetical protein